MLLNHKGKWDPHPSWNLGTNQLGPHSPCRIHTVNSSGPLTDVPVLTGVPLFVTLWTVAHHGISQARILEWGCHIRLQEIFLTQGSNSILLRLLYQQADSLPLRHLGSPSVYRWGMVNRSKDGFPPITRRECVSVSAGQNDLLQGLLLPGAPLTPATFQVTQKKVQSNTRK